VTEDRLAWIEEKLIEISAHREVDSLLLQAIIGQIGRNPRIGGAAST
jgi:hypothetical protein